MLNALLSHNTYSSSLQLQLSSVAVLYLCSNPYESKGLITSMACQQVLQKPDLGVLDQGCTQKLQDSGT